MLKISFKFFLIFIISLLLILIGYYLYNKETFLFTGDAKYYLLLAQGNWSSVDAPFKYRIFVPLIASLLPISPENSLKMVSILSLFFFYVFILLICFKFKLKASSSLVGLTAMWGAKSHIYNYGNPYLTDAFGLLIITLLIIVFLRDNYILFLILTIIGILARETTLFISLIWLFKKNKYTNILLIFVSILTFILPRIFLSSIHDTQSMINAITISINKFNNPISVIKEIFISWGFLWFTSLIGLRYISKNKFDYIILIFYNLLFCSIITSFIATDTIRMFSILAPIIVISNAIFFQELMQQRDYLFAFIFIFLIIFQVFVMMPNIIFIENNTLRQILLFIIQLIGSFLSIVFILLKKIYLINYKGII